MIEYPPKNDEEAQKFQYTYEYVAIVVDAECRKRGVETAFNNWFTDKSIMTTFRKELEIESDDDNSPNHVGRSYKRKRDLSVKEGKGAIETLCRSHE